MRRSSPRALLFVAMGAGNLGSGQNLPVAGRPLTKPIIEPTKLRAYDKATGAAVWEFDTPSRPLASPMTYIYQGKQYLVVAAGGGLSAELIAFALGSMNHAKTHWSLCLVDACWPVWPLA